MCEVPASEVSPFGKTSPRILGHSLGIPRDAFSVYIKARYLVSLPFISINTAVVCLKEWAEYS